MPADLTGKRVLVVGASAGIGREVARRAATIGGDVAWCGRRKERLDDAIAELGRGHAIAADVTDPADCERLIAETVAALGGIDLLIFAASAGLLARLADTEAEAWQAVLATNIIGPALITRAALPHLSAGAVVAYVSSESVGNPYEGVVPYTTSKAGLEEMVRGWRAERPEVRFSTVVVGVTTDTEFARDFDMDLAAELLPKWIALGKLPVQGMTSVELGGLIAESLALAVNSPGVDCQHYVFRAPGGPLIGDASHYERAAEALKP